MSTTHEADPNEPLTGRWSGEAIAEMPSLRLGDLEIPLPAALRGVGPVKVFADVVDDEGAVLQVVLGRPGDLPVKKLKEDRWTRSLAEIVLRERRRHQWVGVARNLESHEVMTDVMFDSWWVCPIGDEAWLPMDAWYVNDPEDVISRESDSYASRSQVS